MPRPESRRAAARKMIDPLQAFRRRAGRDRRQIERALAQLDATVDWPRVAALLTLLENIAHGLAGAGGVFGFSAVSNVASKVERQVERWRIDSKMELSPRRRNALAKSVGLLVAALSAVDREDETGT